ncbi:MAG: ABC transporter ATP-binding protein, partial [Sulfurovum sp. 28-43-6]
MALIDLFEIKKQYDIKLLLDHVDFHLNEGERIAVVGQNGCGKSTLMKIALGTEEPTEGKRVVANTLQVEMLAQQPRFEPTLTVRDAILGELSELKAAQEEHARLSLEVADDFENKLLLEKLEAISTYLDHHNAWNLDDKIERILQEFKLKEYENRLVVSLSGGEQRRVALASLVLKKPDVLLLDEPTNHLDVYMVEFLEEILLKEKFTLLFISHDRHFIDTIATRVIEVENQGLVSYKGGYRDYLHQKEERMLSLAKSHDTLLKMLKREEEWLGKSVRAREKRNQGRKARVFELREQAKKNPTLIRKMQIELEREKKSWRGEKGLSKRKMLFDVEHLGYSIADKLLIKDFSTRILQRDKIAIVGINGAGKSTLLKLLLGRLSPNSGLIDKGEFSIGYFDQHREMLNDTHTLIETFCPNGGDHV